MAATPAAGERNGVTRPNIRRRSLQALHRGRERMAPPASGHELRSGKNCMEQLPVLSCPSEAWSWLWQRRSNSPAVSSPLLSATPCRRSPEHVAAAGGDATPGTARSAPRQGHSPGSGKRAGVSAACSAVQRKSATCSVQVSRVMAAGNFEQQAVVISRRQQAHSPGSGEQCVASEQGVGSMQCCAADSSHLLVQVSRVLVGGSAQQQAALVSSRQQGHSPAQVSREFGRWAVVGSRQ